MADLRELLDRLGFTEARSLLQSGNLVFRSRARASAQRGRLLEAEAETSLALQTDFFGTRATGRNWNTVLKLGTAAEGPP